MTLNTFPSSFNPLIGKRFVNRFKIPFIPSPNPKSQGLRPPPYQTMRKIKLCKIYLTNVKLKHQLHLNWHKRHNNIQRRWKSPKNTNGIGKSLAKKKLTSSLHQDHGCYARTGRSSQREISWSGIGSGTSALATCDAGMW